MRTRPTRMMPVPAPCSHCQSGASCHCGVEIGIVMLISHAQDPGTWCTFCFVGAARRSGAEPPSPRARAPSPGTEGGGQHHSGGPGVCGAACGALAQCIAQICWLFVFLASYGLVTAYFLIGTLILATTAVYTASHADPCYSTPAALAH